MTKLKISENDTLSIIKHLLPSSKIPATTANDLRLSYRTTNYLPWNRTTV